MKNFAMTGVAGYIAPKHLEAIKSTGNQLVACLDPHDSVGVLDRYFPEAAFFTEYERFDRHLEKRRAGPEAGQVQYVTICAPNYLHDAHIRCALRVGAHAICEKPLVLNPWNLDAIEKLERETNRSVSVILQLRLQEEVKRLHRSLSTKSKRHSVVLTYVTPRGKWYHRSWKGDQAKSGGLLSNIGIHFFDLLLYLFGKPKKNILHLREEKRCAGYFELEHADVTWFLSVDEKDVPLSKQEATTQDPGQKSWRSLELDGNIVDISGGFTNLHIKSYEEILAGRGYGTLEARPSIELVYEMRNDIAVSTEGERHPFIWAKSSS